MTIKDLCCQISIVQYDKQNGSDPIRVGSKLLVVWHTTFPLNYNIGTLFCAGLKCCLSVHFAIVQQDNNFLHDPHASEAAEEKEERLRNNATNVIYNTSQGIPQHGYLHLNQQKPVLNANYGVFKWLI